MNNSNFIFDLIAAAKQCEESYAVLKDLEEENNIRYFHRRARSKISKNTKHTSICSGLDNNENSITNVTYITSYILSGTILYYTSYSGKDKNSLSYCGEKHDYYAPY